MPRLEVDEPELFRVGKRRNVERYVSPGCGDMPAERPRLTRDRDVVRALWTVSDGPRLGKADECRPICADTGAYPPVSRCSWDPQKAGWPGAVGMSSTGPPPASCRRPAGLSRTGSAAGPGGSHGSAGSPGRSRPELGVQIRPAAAREPVSDRCGVWRKGPRAATAAGALNGRAAGCGGCGDGGGCGLSQCLAAMIRL